MSIKTNFFLNIFIGFIIITFIVTLVHFFFKIDLIISQIILILGLIIFFKKKNIELLRLFNLKNIPYLIIVFCLIPMFFSQKYHEDFGYYHLPYALGFIEEKIVFGFANIDNSYVYNSIWLNISSLFFLNDKNFNFLTLPGYILFLSFILFSINQIISKKEISLSNLYLVTLIFYFILKFTRISEFGVDLPALIFSVLGIYYFFNFFETNLIEEKKTYFFLTLIFSIFSILIKLSTLPTILLSLYLYFKHFKYLKFSLFDLKFFFILILSTIFFIQQFVYTGCFIFPTKFTCLDVSWFNPDWLNLSKGLELVNKSYSLARDIYLPEDYLSNFTWFSFWIKRNFIEIIEHLMTMILPLLLFIFVLKKRKKNYLVLQNKLTLYTLILLSLLFWLNYSPVFRFAIHIFVTLVFLFFSSTLISKEFSKKKFLIFISVFLIFNFSKNVLRINNTENLFLGIIKIENDYILNNKISNKYANIYYPDVEKNKKNGWQGILCWNTPFICSYNKLDVSKKNGYLIVNKLKN
ncbi:hypothetical protein IDH17_04955 [Pelagibacterales bacterium SAG-MED37]|nr:hypothetical protein [Pelagibacterales bacterium SAG-MED37]